MMSVKNKPGYFPYVDILVDVPVIGDRKFTYKTSENNYLPYGARVQVPFGSRRVDGYVVGYSDIKPDFDVKHILSCYDLKFLPPEHLLRLGIILKEYYLGSTVSFWKTLWPPLTPRLKLKSKENSKLEIDYECFHNSRQTFKFSGDFSETVFVEGPFESRWDYYCAKIEQALKLNQGVIVLVPEIRKLDAAARILKARFENSFRIMHSSQTGTTRRENWLRLLKGETKFVLGTRSAVFSPVAKLGLIIVEEEESYSYKAQEFPRFNAVTVAKARGALENSQVILGSFVASVKTRHDVSVGKVHQVNLPAPVYNDVKVKREIISMLGRKKTMMFSKELHLALRDVFNRGGKAILFINRRGTSSSLICCDCGNAIMCPRCSVPLAYHGRKSKMVCHTCGFRRTPPLECPECKGYTWKPLGYGIDRAISEFQKRFPKVPILGLDQDSESPENIIELFKSTSPVCLLSTQMLFGFDSLPMQFLGVLSCDNMLNLSDYSAPEQVFNLLMNLLHVLKNSTGDGEKTFMVQTLNPKHHAIKAILDSEIFYVFESKNRSDFNYPPFGALFKIEFSDFNSDKAKRVAENFVKEMTNHCDKIQILGPGPAPKFKVRGRYRWIIMLKANKREHLLKSVKHVYAIIPHNQVRITIDTEAPFGIG